MKKRTLLKLSVLMLCLTGSSLLIAEPIDLIEIKGKPHFTFSNNYTILESENMFYKINLRQLKSETSIIIDEASISGKTLNLQLPKSSVSFAWPKSESQIVKNSSQKSQDKHFLNKENGKVEISGNVTFSYDDSYYLLQIENKIIQLDKKRLNREQIEMLNSKNIGETAELKIFENAISYNWKIEVPEIQKYNQSRGIASITADDKDEIVKANNVLYIRGKVLYSASEPTVVVQSKKFIFYMKRSGVVTDKPDQLNLVGSKVEISVPAQQIEFIWQLDE